MSSAAATMARIAGVDIPLSAGVPPVPGTAAGAAAVRVGVGDVAPPGDAVAAGVGVGVC